MNPAVRGIPQAPRVTRRQALGVIGGFLALPFLAACGGGAPAGAGPVSTSVPNVAPPTEAPLPPQAPSPALPPPLHGHFPYDEAPQTSLREVPKDWVIPELKNQRLYLHQDAWEALQELRDVVGFDLKISSGFRSVDEQRGLAQNALATAQAEGKSEAQAYYGTAPAGYSEHHTGYAVDFYFVGDTDGRKLATLTAAATARGWVQSFPEGNTQGIRPEYWHWRYEGTEAARQVFARARALSQSTQAP